MSLIAIAICVLYGLIEILFIYPGSREQGLDLDGVAEKLERDGQSLNVGFALRTLFSYGGISALVLVTFILRPPRGYVAVFTSLLLVILITPAYILAASPSRIALEKTFGEQVNILTATSIPVFAVSAIALAVGVGFIVQRSRN